MEQSHCLQTVLSVLLTVLPCRGSSAHSTLQRSVLVGTEVTLRCVFDSQSKVVEWSDLTVQWNVVDKHAKKSILYTFEDGRAHMNNDGITVDQTGLLQSNASLQLRNVSLAHEGLYTCTIITPVVHTETVSLEVLAQPSVSLPESATVTEGEERTLQCDITGFYPEKLSVTWLVQNGTGEVPAGGSHFSQVCTETAVHNRNGTYSTRSRVTLHSSEVKNKDIRITCRVEHRSYQEPYNRSVTLTVHAPDHGHSVAALVAVTSLISLFLVTSVIGSVLLIYRYFCKAPPNISQISHDSIVYAQVPTHLKCTIQGVREREIKLKWLKTSTSVEFAAQSESVSLLVSEDLSEQASLVSYGKKHHTSVLPLCLALTEDLSKYQCVVMCRGRSVSRDFTVRLKVEPSFLQISSIPQIPKVERLLVLCCRVENFYPRDVYLEWSRNDGEQVRTVAHFGPFCGANSLYSIWSKIQLVMAKEDEKAVYTCRVYHSSFTDPGYKDVRFHINTQGTPPDVRFIKCEPLMPNEECTLHLCIKDFCPENVLVAWTKDGETVDCGVFNTPPSLNINGLYSMFSFLKFTPTAGDRGSVFQCRVVHSAQEDPEERSFTLPDLHPTDTNT